MSPFSDNKLLRFMRKAAFKNLKEACHVVDALGIKARKLYVDRFCEYHLEHSLAHVISCEICRTFRFISHSSFLLRVHL